MAKAFQTIGSDINAQYVGKLRHGLLPGNGSAPPIMFSLCFAAMIAALGTVQENFQSGFKHE